MKQSLGSQLAGRSTRTTLPIIEETRWHDDGTTHRHWTFGTSTVARILVGFLFLSIHTPGIAEVPNEPIQHTVPPVGIVIPQDLQSRLDQQLESLSKQLAAVRQHPLSADVACLIKAVRFAVDHREFYREQDLKLADELLALAGDRLAELSNSPPSWSTAHGLVVRGFYSQVDGSPQPYGLEIPENLDLTQPVPLYVWLHGRGDKTTDLHFISQRLKRPGQVTPENAIVLHPFGRQCLGYKSAGETDVLEAIADVRQHYPIDDNRTVLIGFSMGGAGAWHLGAHFANRWVAVSPGAGFAETAEYNRLASSDYPAWYEQVLWRQYDVPNYARNLFNVPVIAYSGENDKQIQAARVMERAFASEGRELTHLIGPGMGHQYHPDVLREILHRLDQAVTAGRDQQPDAVHFQTQTLKYNRMRWVEALGLDRHWQDSRIDAQHDDDGAITMRTKNVNRLRLHLPTLPSKLEIDGTSIDLSTSGSARENTNSLEFSRHNGRWQLAAQREPQDGEPRAWRKTPGLQGPIDDAFTGPFLVVTPDRSGSIPIIDEWVDFEVEHLQRRWSRLFRGSLRVKSASDVTDDDIRSYHLILWGTPETNSRLRETLKSTPIQWTSTELLVGTRRFDASHHVPVLIYPNPLNPQRYLVVNSGPTFREAHDRTNSLQNPKLPDWAVIDVTQPPSAESPGHVVAAEFFNEAWEFSETRPSLIPPASHP